MLFQAVVIFLPVLNFFKFHVKGERSISDIALMNCSEDNIKPASSGHEVKYLMEARHLNISIWCFGSRNYSHSTN